MRGEIVALDIESTGLDLQVDEMIEIGLARCRGDEIIDTYQTLIRPTHDIPDQVTILTGITNEDVRHAPAFDGVEARIRDFIGHRPVLAHNIDFDLKIMKRYGLAQHNTALDTLELASFLLPNAPRYNLGSLAEQLGVVLDDDGHAHRAMYDTLLCWHVYRKLYAMLREVPLEILTELKSLGTNLDWPVLPIIQDAVEERLAEGEQPGPLFDVIGALEAFTGPPQEMPGAVAPKHFDVDEAASILAGEGAFAAKIPDYEVRQPQIDMLRAVGHALAREHHLIVEAPTGTGKSLAYLLPAAMFAMANNKRVAISTHTLNLQDQILDKDVPFLREHLNWPLRATALKGRDNYLCPRRVETVRRRLPTSVDEMRLMGKLMIWLHNGGTGQKHELNLRYPHETNGWARFSAADEDCSVGRCLEAMDGVCPFYQAHERANEAHLLVVNHALLLSDVVVGNRVMPAYEYLVVDEAHHLEEAITRSLEEQADRFSIARRLNDIGGTESGLLGDVLRSVHSAIPRKHFNKLAEYVKLIEETSDAMTRYVRAYFADLMQVLEDQSEGYVDYSTEIRVTPQVRGRREWAQVSNRWGKLSGFTETLALAMSKLYTGLVTLSPYHDEIEDHEVLFASLQAAADYFQGLHSFLHAFTVEPQSNTIYWAELFRKTEYDHIVLHAAPLHVGILMSDYLWEQKRSITLASATLRTNNTFEYIDDRLNAYDAEHVLVASPFDYASSTLVYLPNDIPEPKQRAEYQPALEEAIIKVGTVTQGRMLVLFTSRAHLLQTAQAVTPALAQAGVVVYDQASGSSRQNLLDNFKQSDKAILMGTRSFWEGVDIPGDDLSVVFITKLPFAVPSDPVFAARAETYGDQSFMEYNMPDAILRFRQGFGRLIRRATDRGVVVIFDKRVISKRYGKLFVDSLPDVTLQRGSVNHLPHATQQWLDDGGEA